MWISESFLDFELIDASDGEKLERWGKYILVRPDPQAIWKTPKAHSGWKNPNARYERSSTGGGRWEIKNLPDTWQIGYKNLKFNIKPMNFKHTGIFPEQAVNWDYAGEKIKAAGRSVSVLNLFAYTGAATVACAEAGASVCHVDAAKGMVSWAKENLAASKLQDKPVRFIVDDCFKFVEREIRRGKKYDAIIMDPPSYGRGPTGEVWKIEDALYQFVLRCSELLTDNPLFFIINSYTSGLAPSVLSYILSLCVKKRFGGAVSCSELGLKVTSTGLILPCGSCARWETNKK